MRLRKRTKSVLILGVVLLHIVGLWVLSGGFESNAAPRQDVEKEEGVYYFSERMMEQDGALQEFAELLDTAPLFLPTAFNYTTQAIRIGEEQEPSLAFEVFEPRLAEAVFTSLSSGGAADNQAILEAITVPQWGPMAVALARGDGAAEASLSLTAYSGEGRLLDQRSVELGVEDAELFARSWRPVRVSVYFDALGMVGHPRREGTTGDPEVDSAIDRIIGGELRGSTVPSEGYVRFLVAP